MQEAPIICRDDLEQIVRREFPAEQFSTVMAILEELSPKSQKNRISIQSNLINLSRGKIEILRKQVKSANDFLAQPRQPVPKVTRRHVERIVRRDFPSEQFEEVMAILDKYGKEKFEVDIDRVQLDVLKLSSGKVDSLRKNTLAAKSDYRDVISAAEYPDHNVEQDWQQYLSWANAK